METNKILNGDALTHLKEMQSDLEQYYKHVQVCSICHRKYGYDAKESSPQICPICAYKLHGERIMGHGVLIHCRSILDKENYRHIKKNGKETCGIEIKDRKDDD